MIHKFVFGKPVETDVCEPSDSSLCALTAQHFADFPSFGKVSTSPTSSDKSSSADSSEHNGQTTDFTYTYIMSPRDILYGLGESTRGINKRGFHYISSCSDVPNQTEDCESLYGAHNFLIVSGEKPFALFFDYPTRLEFDCGYTQEDTLTVHAELSDMTLYVITPDCTNVANSSSTPLENIVTQFRKLTGRSYIPPFWAFGYQQSRWGYRTADDIREVVKQYKDHNIPLDAVYLDIDYMDNYKDFTVDEHKFPNFKQFVSEMKDENIHLVPIIDAGVKVEKGYSVCDEGEANNYFCKKADGSDFVGGVWPGNSHFPDFLNEDARKWFGMQYKKLTDDGIEGFWNDMNEPALFYSTESLAESFKNIEKYKGRNLDIQSFFQFADISRSSFNKPSDYTLFYHTIKNKDGSLTKIRHDKVHNLYGYNMTRAASEAFKTIAPNKRMLLFSRASFIGAHRYGGIWTGDNSSRWDHLTMGIKMMPSLNMCGFLYTGTDIGGFGGNTTRELLLRWLAFGDFTPLMRNHSADGTRRQECWQFDNTNDFASVIGLRYRLIPYLYSEFMKAALSDTMYFKPLAFEYTDDTRCRTIEDELLVGNDLLIAPVHEQNAEGRMVYLPEDMTLVRYHNNEVCEQTLLEKGDHYISVPLADVVFFIKKNHIVPLCRKNAANTALIDCSSFDFAGIAPKGTTCTFYKDDGTSPAVSLEKGIVTLHN